MRKLIAAYHHGFTGGSKNTSRLLQDLPQDVFSVEAYFHELPHFFEYTIPKIKTHIYEKHPIVSEVIAPYLTDRYLPAQQIIRDLQSQPNEFVFLGANLFPNGDILLDVKSQLATKAKLILHPVGSDIWQIGVQMPLRVKWLLEHPQVDRLFTYSDTFVREIKEYFNIEREICILPPVVESTKFFSIDSDEIKKRKALLGLDEDSFIIHHHSSMRKVKCPETILAIAQKTASVAKRKCILFMVGNIPFELLKELHLTLTKMPNEAIFQYQSHTENLTIYWTGLVAHVEYLLQISDVELNASLHDSFNISLMEAMACGVPVVSSDVVGISEHIIKAQAGYVFKTQRLPFDELNHILNLYSIKNKFHDIEGAVHALIELSENPLEAKAKGAMGNLYVNAHFNALKISQEFQQYLS